MARDITEKQHDEAVRVLRAEYYGAVRGIVDEAMGEMKDGNITDREGLDEWIWQSVDGSYWVIYTHANFQVLFCSDNHDAYEEEYGEPPVEHGSMNWAALAFAAMRRDVYDLVGSYEDEIDELLVGEARRRRPRASAPPRRPAEAPRHRRRRPAPRSKAPRKKAPRKAPRRRR